jgi:hypothetical protein
MGTVYIPPAEKASQIIKKANKNAVLSGRAPPRAAPDYADCYSLQEQSQIGPSDFGGTLWRNRETPPFKPLRPERKTITVPVQRFEHVAPSAHKHEERSICGFPSERFAHQTR